MNGLALANAPALESFTNTRVGENVAVTLYEASASGFSLNYDAVASGDSLVITSAGLSDAPFTLAVGRAVVLEFTYASEQLGGLNMGFRWGLGFGETLVMMRADTGSYAGVFLRQSLVTGGGDPTASSGSSNRDWSLPDDPPTEKHFKGGNSGITVATTITRVSGSTYEISVEWGGKVYSHTGTLTGTDHGLRMVFFGHGQLTGGGVSVADNYTISNVSLVEIVAPFSLSDAFVNYLRTASNPDLFGLRDDGRFYPYSPPAGRRIGYGLRVSDKDWYLQGLSVSEAEGLFRMELDQTVEQLRPLVLAKTGQEFDGLSRDSQEILVDFGYTEGVDQLSDTLIQAAVSLNWAVLLRPEVYARYEVDWPDNYRNKAFFDRWKSKGGM